MGKSTRPNWPATDPDDRRDGLALRVRGWAVTVSSRQPGVRSRLYSKAPSKLLTTAEFTHSRGRVAQVFDWACLHPMLKHQASKSVTDPGQFLELGD
jgi:hypothetical protein